MLSELSIISEKKKKSAKVTFRQKLNILGCGVVLDELSVLHLVSFSNTVDLLVDLGTVVVALLTSPRL